MYRPLGKLVHRADNGQSFCDRALRKKEGGKGGARRIQQRFLGTTVNSADVSRKKTWRFFFKYRYKTEKTPPESRALSQCLLLLLLPGVRVSLEGLFGVRACSLRPPSTLAAPLLALAVLVQFHYIILLLLLLCQVLFFRSQDKLRDTVEHLFNI